MRCANCGIGEGDDIKLKTCTACKSVRYCGVKCQKQHRPKHKRDCKKREAEFRDEILFRQPASSHCPICFLPMPLDNQKSTFMNCCNKFICNGCFRASEKIDAVENKDSMCPFCRHPNPTRRRKLNRGRLRRKKLQQRSAPLQCAKLPPCTAERGVSARSSKIFKGILDSLTIIM